MNSQSSNRQELLRLIGEEFGDLPPFHQVMSLIDVIYGKGQEGTTGAHTYDDVYRRTREDVVVSVVGGTRLEDGVPKEQRRYYHLNRKLARYFVRQPLKSGKRGWSFATGQGGGKAMAGPHYCLGEARKAYQDAGNECESKCIGVPSGLTDEPPHPFADDPFTLLQMVDAIFRELRLIALSSDGMLVYPGFKGSLFELVFASFINYTAGRTESFLPPIPIIVVDQFNPTGPQPFGMTHKEFVGKSFYHPLLRSFVQNAELMGVTKPGTGNGVSHIDVADGDCARKIVGYLRASIQERQGWNPDEHDPDWGDLEDD